MAKARSNNSEALSFDTVVELLTMLDGSDLPTRIVYKNGPLRLEVERGGPLTAVPAVATAPPAAAAPAAPTSAAPAVPADLPTVGERTNDGPGEPVPAPIAGVFYRAPGPDADPFVEVGQQVTADDVIGIVEVMKLMNTVRAGVAGTIVEICVENNELVEFEQALVRIDCGA